MKKNGFTLIELLAVIVILAIIALIATPIILGIINDAREKANERSVELYASAVRNAVAAYQLTGTSAPTSFSDLDIQYDGEVKCTVQELYSDGSFYLEGCKVNNGEKEYSYGTKKGPSITPICNPATASTLGYIPTKGEYSVGDEYICNVDGTNRTFFILKVDGEKLSLIMNEDIASDVDWGYDMSFAANQDACDGASMCGNISSGPFTAMDKLHELTKNWNVPNININYDDSVYGGLRTSGSKTILTNYQGEEVASYENLKARLPLYSEVKDLDSAVWLVNGTTGDYEHECDPNNGCTSVTSNWGYWTLTTYDDYSKVYAIGSYGLTYGFVVTGDGVIESQGIRPVIELTPEYLNN